VALNDATAVLTAVSTLAAAVAATAAVRTSRSALAMQRLSVGLEGRRIAAADIARWAITAGEAIERVHDPETWKRYIPPGADLVPPSHGRIAPGIEAHAAAFEPMRELARLSFGDQHEVTRAVEGVIDAIQEVANRGLIYGPEALEEGNMTPREYVTEVFWPRVVHLHEALTAALDLTASQPRPPSTDPLHP